MSTRETVRAFFYANPYANYKQAGAVAGVSTQRAKQIVDTEPELKRTLKELRKERRDRNYEVGAAKRRRRYGGDLTHEEFHAMEEESYRYKRWQLKRADASRKKIEFTIQYSDLDWPEFCPVLGIKLDYTGGSVAENSCSFDRLDPSKGYIIGNVHVISWRANRIKNDGTSEEHRRIAEYINNTFLKTLDREGLGVL